MGNSNGNTDEKSTKASQNDKTKGKRWNMLGQKGKSNTRKIIILLEEINQKVLTKGVRLKRYRERVKRYGQNNRRGLPENIPTTGCKRS